MTDLSALIFFDKKTGEYVFICPQMTQIFSHGIFFSHGMHGKYGSLFIASDKLPFGVDFRWENVILVFKYLLIN